MCPFRHTCAVLQIFPAYYTDSVYALSSPGKALTFMVNTMTRWLVALTAIVLVCATARTTAHDDDDDYSALPYSKGFLVTGDVSAANQTCMSPNVDNSSSSVERLREHKSKERRDASA